MLWKSSHNASQSCRGHTAAVRRVGHAYVLSCPASCQPSGTFLGWRCIQVPCCWCDIQASDLSPCSDHLRGSPGLRALGPGGGHLVSTLHLRANRFAFVRCVRVPLIISHGLTFPMLRTSSFPCQSGSYTSCRDCVRLMEACCIPGGAATATVQAVSAGGRESKLQSFCHL